MTNTNDRADDFSDLTPNQKRALSKGLAALETMAALWASEIRLSEMAKRIADATDPAERAKRVQAMLELAFTEGAYRHYLDHKDKCDRAAISSAVPDGGKEAAELTDTYLAHMAYAGFGIVCDDTEAVQFARFVIAQDRQRRAAPLALPDGGKGEAVDASELAAELWRAATEKELIDMATIAGTRFSDPFQSGFLQCVEEIATRLHLSDEARNFSTAPQAESAPRALTDEQIHEIWVKSTAHTISRRVAVEFARAIEQAVNKGAGND